MCYCTGCFVDLHASITMDVLAIRMNMFEKSRNYNTHNFSTTCSASAQVEFFSDIKIIQVSLESLKTMSGISNSTTPKIKDNTNFSCISTLIRQRVSAVQCHAVFFPYHSEVIDLINSDTPRVFGCDGFLLCG